MRISILIYINFFCVIYFESKLSKLFSDLCSGSN